MLSDRVIHFYTLPYDGPKANLKASSPQIAIQFSFFEFPVSPYPLKVIQ
jgi:hypothetical protein